MIRSLFRFGRFARPISIVFSSLCVASSSRFHAHTHRRDALDGGPNGGQKAHTEDTTLTPRASSPRAACPHAPLPFPAPPSFGSSRYPWLPPVRGALSSSSFVLSFVRVIALYMFKFILHIYPAQPPTGTCHTASPYTPSSQQGSKRVPGVAALPGAFLFIHPSLHVLRFHHLH